METDAAKLEGYRLGALRRRKALEADRARRREHALSVAREAARLLREDFGVTKVVVFGSAARGRFFDEHSDLDLAVWGLDERNHYRAQGRLLGLDPDLSIDLVRVEDVSSELRTAIERDGVEL